MKPLWTLVSKEIRDNIRDRRSLFFALLYGPVLLPLLMVGPMLYGINQHTIDHESPTEIAVEGKDHAPSLVQFLHRHYLDAVAAPDDVDQALADGEFDVVLTIPEAYGERFGEGQPAPLVIHYTSDRDDSNNRRRQLNSVLERYSEQVRAQRFSSRGMDSRTFEPLDISEQDQSDAPGDLLTIAYLIPFLLMFSMLMGGYYLAVDTTAGERERQSLEPLLSLPLKRFQIVLGKYLAILAFVSLAMVLPLMTSFLLFSFLPMDLFDHRLHFGAQTFAIALLSNIPSALLITGFLMAIAAFTRTTKEAQTHLSFAMFLPIVPFFALQFLTVPRDTFTMMVPLLSQFQIMEMAVLNHAIPAHYLLLSAGGSIAVAVICVVIAIRLYQRERILL